MYAIYKKTPAISYQVMTAETKKEARQYLSEVLADYKADYRQRHARKGYGLKAMCHWLNRDSIAVHEINDDDMPGDMIVYSIA